MPTYEYRCEQCGFIFEASHSMSGNHDLSFRRCGSGAKKIITGGSSVIGFITMNSSWWSALRGEKVTRFLRLYQSTILLD